MKLLITRDEVKHIAWLSKISLSEDQEELFTKQFNEILNYFKKLDEVDVSKASIGLYVTQLRNTYRNDEIGECLTEKDVLKNVPETEKGFIKAPKTT